MNYEKSQNETEILGADEQKLREMCCSLKKVEAPHDFDFKLKARIANSKASDFQPRLGFTFRYALPVLALILVVGLLAYNSRFLSSKDNPLVAESSSVPQNPALPQNSAVSNFSPAESQPQTSETPSILPQDSTQSPEKQQLQVAENNTQKTKKDFRENKKDSFVGSKDFASTEDKGKQPNFNSITIPKNLQNIERPNPMPVKDILLTNGINADFENGKWIVKSVTTNSVGESSGVKENDVIEAIDNQSLSADTVFNNTVNGKTITVTRNGEKSQIRLRNKQ